MTFQEQLLKLIKEKSISESDIAHGFGVSIPTVKRWITGTNEPHIAMQKHVFEFLNAL